MIEIHNLSYSYRDGVERIHALRDIHLLIQQGEWVSVTGMNGSGKSTLSRMFNGLLIPTGGTIHVAGLNLNSIQNRQLIKRKLQVVFQNPDAQMIGSTPIEDVSFGLESKGLTRDEIKHRIEDVLQKVGLNHKLTDEVSSLSGGQRQRLAIASCLALEPEIIVFDEATSMIDPIGRKEIYQIARSMWQKGKTVIWITQRLEEITNSERVVVLDKGNVCFDGHAGKLFYNSDIPERFRWNLPPVIQIGRVLKELGMQLEDLPLDEEELEHLSCELNLQM